MHAVEPLPGSTDETFHAPEPLSGSTDQTFHALEPLSGSTDETFHAPEPLSGSTDQTFHALEPLSGSTDETFHAPEPLSGSTDEAFHAPEPLPVARRLLAVLLGEQLGSLLFANMSTATKTVSRPLAVLRLPRHQAPLLVAYARSVVLRMTNNPTFPSPRPTLAEVEAAIEALQEAETRTLTGLVGSVAERDEKRAAVERLLEQLRSHVQATADADPAHAPSIIESAGMSVKHKGGPAPREFIIKQGPVSGLVLLIAPQAGRRVAYEWQYSTDGMTTWVSLPVTVQANTRVDGLTPASRVHARYRTTTKEGTGDWSDPVSIIVS